MQDPRRIYKEFETERRIYHVNEVSQSLTTVSVRSLVYGKTCHWVHPILWPPHIHTALLTPTFLSIPLHHERGRSKGVSGGGDARLMGYSTTLS